MAKSILTPALSQLRGKVGNLVFRRLYGRTVVSAAPDFSRRKLSAAQKAHCQRFKTAAQPARLALKDPKRKAAYQATARRQNRPLIAVAISARASRANVSAWACFPRRRCRRPLRWQRRMLEDLALSRTFPN